MHDAYRNTLCSFRRIRKWIFDPRFTGFRGRKEREIRNWMCNLGDLSQTRAICMAASPEMTCFLLFDKLCDYTVQNFVFGSSNSDDWTNRTRKKRVEVEIYLKVAGSVWSSFVARIFYVTRSSAHRFYKRVCRNIAVHLSPLLLICVFKQSQLATNGYNMDILLHQEQSSRSKIRFWIHRKEHTLKSCRLSFVDILACQARNDRFFCCYPFLPIKRLWSLAYKQTTSVSRIIIPSK